MSQDVTQWLDEIKTLRAQLVTLQRERDEAFTESVTWRDRLDAEMKLRLREAELLREQIATLEAVQPKTDEGNPTSRAEAGADLVEPQREAQAVKLEKTLAQLTTVEDLREFVTEVAKERDRLRRALEQERQAHQETRENLSIALGDAIDLLAHRHSSKSSG